MDNLQKSFPTEFSDCMQGAHYLHFFVISAPGHFMAYIPHWNTQGNDKAPSRGLDNRTDRKKTLNITREIAEHNK